MKIFNFVGEKSNDMLSKMSEKDRHELLELLKDYRISLRDRLALNQNVTFGLEFEFGTDNPSKVESQTKSLNYRWLMEKRLNGSWYDFKKETSSTDGYEISTPVLTDSVETWKQVKEICSLIENNRCRIDERDAGHIHFGTQIIGNNVEEWLTFFRLYCLYENIIYRFSYGEFEKERSFVSTYAAPLAKEYTHRLDKLDEDITIPSIRKMFTTLAVPHKKCAMQFYKVSEGGTSYEKNRTFEFRMPNASTNPVIWQNNVNFFAHFISCVKNGNLDIELLKRKTKEKLDELGKLSRYNLISIDEALELADLIFDTNLDKINFLRQYMKEFETNDEFRKSESFIK